MDDRINQRGSALRLSRRHVMQVAGWPAWRRSLRPRWRKPHARPSRNGSTASARARCARGVSEATYARVMGGLKPDTTRVQGASRSQPEFNEKLWQYLNRRVSDWRIVTGKEKAKEYAALLARIEQDFGVEPLGDARPVGHRVGLRRSRRAEEPHASGHPGACRRWPGASRAGAPIGRQELLNALVIIERGWGTPAEMNGSWAGAMGHTQWMPEVWLNVGMDYDRDGRVSPFGKPDDALGSTARYLVKRGKYRRGEHWGYEVRVPAGVTAATPRRSYDAWQKAGVVRADGKPFPQPSATAKLWVPVPGGPAFLLGPNFYAVRSYNPSMNYTLSIVHLGDRVVGGERVRAEIPRQRARADARRGAGNPAPPDRARLRHRRHRRPRRQRHHDARCAISSARSAWTPADGYAGVTLLARLREAR